MTRRALFLAVAVMVAGCGSTVDASRQAMVAGDAELDGPGAVATATTVGGAEESEGPSSGAGGPRTAPTSRPGAAAASAAKSTGPITVGIVRTAVSNAAAFGATLGDTVSEADVYDAIIEAFNAAGGINGRKIVPVYDETDTGSGSWDADFAAACAKFTQDNAVVAVLGYVFDYVPSFESCLAKKGIPHLSTSFNIPDANELRQFPLLVALSTPRIERRSRVKIDGAIAVGTLTRSNRIGVLTDSCPGTQAAWTQVTKPYLLSKGMTIAMELSAGCPRGSGDAASAAGQVSNFILKARSAQVDTVMFNSVSEGPALLIVSGAAEAQGWRPRYLVSSLANAAVLERQINGNQAANVHGFGWLPVQDVNQVRWPGLSSAQTRCRAMVQSRSINLQSATDYSFAFNLCEALFAYEKALKANGMRTDGRSVVSAIEAFGTNYVSALNLEGRSSFSSTQHDGPAIARYFSFDGGCRCFTYRPTTVPVR